MRYPHPPTTLIQKWRLSANVIIGLIAASTSLPVAAGVASTAPLPRYEAGDTFVYFDGKSTSTVKVKSVQGDLVNYVDPKDGSQWTYFRNFALPIPKWRGEEKYGTTTQYFIGDISGFFPLKLGNVMEYDVEGRTSKSNNWWSYKTRCEVSGQGNVAVKAGTFNVLRVDCVSNQWGWKRTYFYAPRLELVIKMIVTKEGQPPKTQELVSFKRANR